MNKKHTLRPSPCRLETPQISRGAQCDTFIAVRDPTIQLHGPHSAPDLNNHSSIESQGLFSHPESVPSKRNRNATPPKTSVTRRRRGNAKYSQCYESCSTSPQHSRREDLCPPKSLEVNAVDGPNDDDTFFLEAPGSVKKPLGTKYFLRPRLHTFTSNEVEFPTALPPITSSSLVWYIDRDGGRAETTTSSSSLRSQSLNTANNTALHDDRWYDDPLVSSSMGLRMKRLRARWNLFDNCYSPSPFPLPDTTSKTTTNIRNHDPAANTNDNNKNNHESRTTQGRQVISSSRFYPCLEMEHLSSTSFGCSSTRLGHHSAHEYKLPYFPTEEV